MLSIVSLEVMKQQITSWVSGPAVPLYAVVVAMVIIATMPLYPFLSTWFGSIYGNPLAWKALKDIALFVTAAVLGVWVLLRHQWSVMKKDTLLWVLTALVFVMVIKSIWHHEMLTEQVLAGAAMNGRYLLIFFIGYVALRYGGVRMYGIEKVLPIIAWIGVGLAILGALQVFVLPPNTLEAFGYDKETTIAPFTVIDDNPDALRAFATLRGPNDYGAYLLLTTIAAAVLSIRKKLWALGVFVMVFAMVLSSSRSSWLGLAVAFGVLAALVYSRGSKKVKQLVVGIGILGAVAGITLLIAATTVPSLRLAIFHSSPDDTHLTEGSTDNHWKASAAGIGRVVEEPLGCGVGCSGPASFYSDTPKIAENYFIQIAEEIGIVGLISWLALFGLILHRLWEYRANSLALTLFASGIGLSVIGIWLHVWTDDPVALTWWGLSGFILGALSTRPKPKNTVH